ncbi:MAG: helix-turn-helix transcriptional regulator [Bdellovibrionales bacterium]|nr:helix-turn-helix transcriptional regulator [Bdellovibrionales bacterium]
MRSEKDICLDAVLNVMMKRHGYSLHQIAKDLNINKSTVHNYMNGVVPQGVCALIKFSNHFKVPIETLLFGESQTHKSPPSLKEQILHLLEKSNESREANYEIIIRKIK